MFNLDPGKLLIIGVVAVMVLGPDKLPRAARQVGDAWRSFDEFRHRMEADIRDAVPDLPSTEHLVRLARSPAALFEHLGTMDSSSARPGATDRVRAFPDAPAPSPDPPVHGDAGLN